MANLSIYSHLLQPSQPLDVGGAVKEGMNLKQLSMQNQQMSQAMDAGEKKRKLEAALPVMEHLASLTPEQRATAYPQAQKQMIDEGVMDPSQALPEHDENSFQYKWAMVQKSPEYRAIQTERQK